MIIPHGTIVLAADAHKALIYRNEGDETYPVLQTLRHEETDTPSNREIAADRQGGWYRHGIRKPPGQL